MIEMNSLGDYLNRAVAEFWAAQPSDEEVYAVVTPEMFQALGEARRAWVREGIRRGDLEAWSAFFRDVEERAAGALSQ